MWSYLNVQEDALIVMVYAPTAKAYGMALLSYHSIDEEDALVAMPYSIASMWYGSALKEDASCAMPYAFVMKRYHMSSTFFSFPLRSVYDRLSHFLTPEVRAPYWCVVLKGMACGYTLENSGQRRIHWFATELQGFAGVRHLYTPSPSEHYIQFTEVSTVFCIPASRMRDGQKQFAELSEYLHVMKQQYIDRQDKLVEVLQQPSAFGRYAKFQEIFPALAWRMMPDETMDFINIARPTYYRVQKRYRDGRRGES